MSNTIKYSTQTENNTLKKGNFVIGVNDVDYGPTSETGYHNTITPPEGGYVVYKNRGDNERSIYVAQNDEELVTLKDDFGATGSTANDILVWAAQQSDVIILNNPLDNIVTDGLVFYVDAAFSCSYPKTDNTWYDLSGKNSHGILVNGPTYQTQNGGEIRLDGSNDYINVPSWDNSSTYNTIEMFTRWRSGNSTMFIGFTTYDIWTRNNNLGFNTGNGDVYGISSTQVSNLNLIGTSQDNWHHYIFLFTNQVQNNKIYIDAQLQTLSQQDSTTNLTTNRSFQSSFTIGSWNNNRETYNINADYGYVRVYNRELTQEEITQNYNAQKSRFGL